MADRNVDINFLFTKKSNIKRTELNEISRVFQVMDDIEKQNVVQTATVVLHEPAADDVDSELMKEDLRKFLQLRFSGSGDVVMRAVHTENPPAERLVTHGITVELLKLSNSGGAEPNTDSDAVVRRIDLQYIVKQ
jgi:hypothetical protein